MFEAGKKGRVGLRECVRAVSCSSSCGEGEPYRLAQASMVKSKSRISLPNFKTQLDSLAPTRFVVVRYTLQLVVVVA